jgi:hypothetical protein
VGDSVYNLENGVFRTVANPYVSPGDKLRPSVADGAQIEHKMGFYLTAAGWNFYFDDRFVGLFPLEWFRNGPLVSGARRIKFGGEVGSNLPVWSAMGSGRHASAGFGKAAYQRAATVYPVGGGSLHANLRDAGSTNGRCYTVDITNNSPSPWGTYLYFGGPGGNVC